MNDMTPRNSPQPPPQHFDVLVIGAGLSGIGAGYHLQHRCPKLTYAILEGREAIGGTWDLFRYPGIRSDSDMYTLGYSFRPWTDDASIAGGGKILDYVRDTAREFGIDRHIRFSTRVTRASWSSQVALWTVDATIGENAAPKRFTCRYLYTCTGYYDYDEGHSPQFDGSADFEGRIVHPQHWPEDLDYAGKTVIVIGSGATAVTLVPAMAAMAAKVTMLQRSPTYIVSLPGQDQLAISLRKWLPETLAYKLVRWRNVAISIYLYKLARRKPKKFKAGVLRLIRKALGPDYDLKTHFTPSYDPWDQRLCLVPDGDLFEAMKAGKAEIVTERIDRFVENGIRLESQETLPADIIVTATGLKLKLLGGLQIIVDGEPVDLSETTSYKGLMYSDVPNLATAFGYTNASWTLKADLTSEYVCRLINHMDKRGLDIAVPRKDDSVGEAPLIDFSSGYVQRAIDRFPSQGTKTPWKLHQNYVLDALTLRFGRIDDGTMKFSRRTGARAPAANAAA